MLIIMHLLFVNTLATERLRGNSAGICFKSFSIIMQYAGFAHLTTPPVLACLLTAWVDIYRYTPRATPVDVRL